MPCKSRARQNKDRRAPLVRKEEKNGFVLVEQRLHSFGGDRPRLDELIIGGVDRGDLLGRHLVHHGINVAQIEFS